MNSEFDEFENYKTKMGCGCWFVLIIFLLIVVWAATGLYKLYYNSEVKESMIVSSHSPHNRNKVEVIHIGQGSMKVKIKYGKKELTKIIQNDGQSVGSSNVKVKWINDYEALVILDGKEQYPKSYRIHFPEK